MALAAVQNYALIQHCNSLKLLCSAGSDTCFANETDKITDIYRKEPVVELHRFCRDIGPRNLRTLHTHVASVFNDLSAQSVQEYTGVFETVPVSARIKNAVCFNTDRFPAVAGRTRHSVFRHWNIPPFLLASTAVHTAR